MKRWWLSLSTAPEPLTRNQSLFAWIIGTLVAGSRFVALSKSAWEWDEALFIQALRHYDVVDYSPHPPGYPLFIAGAKIFTLIGLSEFHALQAVVLAAAIALFPVTLLLGRELRFSAEASLIAATIVAFLPNMWIYGGTAFSDLPAAVLAMVAAALFLRGCRSDRALFAAGALLGIAIGFRPQNALIAAAPALIAVARRRWRALLAVCAAAAIVVVTYGVAAILSQGVARYIAVIRMQSTYVSQVDSFHSPYRKPLMPLLKDVYIRPFAASPINNALEVFGAIGLIAVAVRRDIRGWLVIAMFLPVSILIWLYLAREALSRYAVAYMPLSAFLATCGLMVLPWWLRRPIAVALVGVMIGWTWPIARELHRRRSPPAEAMNWIAAHSSPAQTMIWAHGSMAPMVSALLPQFRAVDTGDGGPGTDAGPRDIYVREGVLHGATVFERHRRRMAGVMRNRFFEVSVMPAQRVVTFADGFYGGEGPSGATFYWMANFGRITLPALHREGRLTLSIYVPLDILPVPPAIDISANGTLLDHIQSQAADVNRTYIIDAQRPVTVDIRTNEIAKPKGDPRYLGLRVNSIEWR